MKKTLLTFILISVFAINTANAEDAQKHLILVNSDKGNIGEICPELKTGQTLHFEFEANKEVKFNLHYHQGEKVTYPIEVQKLQSIKQTFKAPIDQTYCLMWEGLEDKSNIKVTYFTK